MGTSSAPQQHDLGDQPHGHPVAGLRAWTAPKVTPARIEQVTQKFFFPIEITSSSSGPS